MSTPLNADPRDLAVVEEKVKAAGTSFYQGMRVLAPDRRYGMYAIYAFCRIVDDIADEVSPIAEQRRLLNEWRARIAALYHGQADEEVSRVLLRAVEKFNLRERDFQDVIDGMEMDAGDPIVAPDCATLDLYCDRVAAAVGRLSVRAFGDASPRADEVAFHLGRALQLTNILRDIAEDAERGRLYLPREFLRDAGIAADLSAVTSPALPHVCARLAGQAHMHFRTAQAAMAHCDRRAMKPARLMAATYGAILTRLERRGWANLRQRVSLPKWQKLYLAIRHGLCG